jgi:hypothetical protein
MIFLSAGGSSPSARHRVGRATNIDRQLPGPAPSPAQPKSEPEPDIDAEVRLYAALYPDRVARIREAGGLPPRLDFGPPEPEIVAALLRGVVPCSQPQSRESRQ